MRFLDVGEDASLSSSLDCPDVSIEEYPLDVNRDMSLLLPCCDVEGGACGGAAASASDMLASPLMPDVGLCFSPSFSFSSCLPFFSTSAEGTELRVQRAHECPRCALGRRRHPWQSSIRQRRRRRLWNGGCWSRESWPYCAGGHRFRWAGWILTMIHPCRLRCG